MFNWYAIAAIQNLLANTHIRAEVFHVLVEENMTTFPFL